MCIFINSSIDLGSNEKSLQAFPEAWSEHFRAAETNRHDVEKTIASYKLCLSLRDVTRNVLHMEPQLQSATAHGFGLTIFQMV
jgi:hypothetical protein